ncbi:MAG: 16S rRNA (cytosine(967)-C(5))-methyltransferase RsmB [Ruminococcaceae bacterium]|nr:16S rRNA (cytosine(967)-C(5))-methyltransferase RsmB [Oscillospiraceae bacterium]
MSKSARQIAYEILLKIEVDEAYSNLAIDSAVKMYNPDSTDCAFISRLVYGVTERKITLDYAISQYLSKPVKKTEILTVLRLGAYQLLYMDKIPQSAAVNESVKLAKNNKCEFASGLVNAVLRKIGLNGLDYKNISSETEKISVTYSMPEDSVKFLIHHYGKENTEEFLKASLEPKEIFIRVNTVKTTTTKELKEILIRENVKVFDTYLENALKIEINNAVYNLESFKKGLFHVEDLSSQLCVEALELFPGANAVDVCAAPGGKTFTAAQYMENKGTLYSCDVYSQRTDLIKSGAERLGLSCVRPFVNDATVFNEDLPRMDRVLCDVPCSGLGIIGKKPEIKYKKLDDTKSLLPIQRQILETSSKYVKSGGRLIYSTCSVNPNENRKICDAFLKDNADFYSVKVLPHIERAVDEGDYLTLFPHKNNCDGFFIAAFQRR